MPTLQESTQADTSNYSRSFTASVLTAAPPAVSLEPVFSSMMRCPLPLVLQMTGDTQRQFYQGSQVPQIRFLVPPPATATGGGSNTGTAFLSETTGGGGSGPVPSPLVPQTATSTAVLSPNTTFNGTINISQSFQLLSLTTTNAARVRLYGTLLAQTSDSARGLDVPPPAGTMQNLICDVALDTVPTQWTFQNRTGANGDSPQNGYVYISVTNLSLTTASIMVALTYIALET